MTVAELQARMTWPELMLWAARDDLKAQQRKLAAQKAKRGRGR